MTAVGHYVQYGCGLSAPASWTNFDASPTLRIQRIPLVGRTLTRNGPAFPSNVRYGDIVKGLPVAPASCAGVYCSHVLEHLALTDLRRALVNTYGCLCPGGMFRFVLPDLEVIARVYLTSSVEQPASWFMESAHLGYRTRARGVAAFLRESLGNSRHLWMWDYRSLEVELRNAGFVAIRRASFGDSEDERFCDVEDPGRWRDCLGIECRRPDEEEVSVAGSLSNKSAAIDVAAKSSPC